MRRTVQRGLTSIIAVTVVLGLAPFTTHAAPTESYIAVIDAGSSGTRLTLYGDDAGSLVPIEVAKAKTNTRGLSSFAGAPADAGPQAIAPLVAQLDDALATLGVARADVPVAILATAGMRDVRLADPQAAQQTMDSAGAAVTAAGHPLQTSRILPAAQEAALAWLDANVIAGNLTSPKRSLGIIEVGGASAQVAFRSTTESGPAVTTVKVAGTSIPVVAVSYLGLGANSARTTMQEANDAGSFCFPNNRVGTAPTTYSSGIARPVTSATANFAWDRCSTAYAGTITTVGDRRTSSAKVAPRVLRTLPGFAGTSFVGLGAVDFLFKDLSITNAANEKAALRRATKATCTGIDAWPRVLAVYSGKVSTFSENLCSSATYNSAFIFGEEGVGLSSRQYVTGSADRSPSWPSGYAVTVLDP